MQKLEIVFKSFKQNEDFVSQSKERYALSIFASFRQCFIFVVVVVVVVVVVNRVTLGKKENRF